MDLVDNRLYPCCHGRLLISGNSASWAWHPGFLEVSTVFPPNCRLMGAAEREFQVLRTCCWAPHLGTEDIEVCR